MEPIPSAPALPETAAKPRIFGRAMATIAVFLLAALLFSAGNIASYLGIVDIGDQLRLIDPDTKGSDDPEAIARFEQLAARLREVANILDDEALATFAQSSLDADTSTAIRALLESSGDQYARYFTKEELAEYQRMTRGEYYGIGIVLTARDELIRVLDVYPDSPAQEAGIKPDDILVAIDGVRKQWELSEATEAIHRDEGDQVTIIWMRDGQERTTPLTLRSVTVPNCTWELQGDVGYIRLYRYREGSAEEIRTAVTELEKLGAGGFILDVRDNPGGLLSQSIDVTSLFVERGTVVEIETKNRIERKQVSGKIATNKPLVYLVNSRSASASELVGAALQDHGRATIVGEKTFGKGTVQDMRELSFGGALKYTIAHYYSPDGVAIDGVGITPDIEVAPGAEDPQLAAALDALRAMIGTDGTIDTGGVVPAQTD
ncbi:MAG: PDZ domain-containing protein [Coriobacteriaceae bacterium]|nr:PDZ domain-containing protein [Coriobacteriaceae bacterium]